MQAISKRTTKTAKSNKQRRALLALIDTLGSADIDANSAQIIAAVKAIKAAERDQVKGEQLDMFSSQASSDFLMWQENFVTPSLFTLLPKGKK